MTMTHELSKPKKQQPKVDNNFRTRGQVADISADDAQEAVEIETERAMDSITIPIPKTPAVTLEVPVSASSDSGYQGYSKVRQLSIVLTDKQFQGLQLGFNGTWNMRMKLANGEAIKTKHDFVRWILEQLADGGADALELQRAA